MKKAPTMEAMMMRYLMAQNPFWMPARGSLEERTPIISRAIVKKKSVTMKQTLQRRMHLNSCFKSFFKLFFKLSV